MAAFVEAAYQCALLYFSVSLRLCGELFLVAATPPQENPWNPWRFVSFAFPN